MPSIAKWNASSLPLSGLPLYGEKGAWLVYRGTLKTRGIQRISDPSTAVAAFLILRGGPFVWGRAPSPVPPKRSEASRNHGSEKGHGFTAAGNEGGYWVVA